MDEVIPTKEERITKIVNALKTTPKGKLSYDRDPSSPPILALSPKTENKEHIDQPKEPQPSADYYTIDIDHFAKQSEMLLLIHIDMAAQEL